MMRRSGRAMTVRSRWALTFGAAVVGAACGSGTRTYSTPMIPPSDGTTTTTTAVAPAAAPSQGATQPAVVEVPAPDEPGPAPVAVGTGGHDNWLMFHGDAARSGVSQAPPLRSPKVRWKAQVGIQSWLNAPLVVAHVVLVPSSGTAHDKPDPKDGLYALDLTNGKRLWFAHLDDDANGAAVLGSRVYVGSDDGQLYAIELGTGKIAWTAKAKGKVYSHPLPLKDRVVVGDGHGYVRAFAAGSGKELWSVQLTGAVRGGMAADASAIYAVSEGGEVAAIGYDGKVRWRDVIKRPGWDHKGPDQVIGGYPAPLLSGSDLIVPFARDTYYKDEPALVALDKKTGTVRWRAKGPGDWGNLRSTPVLVAGLLVYSEPYSGDVVGISAGDGRMRYRKPLGPCYFPQYASPAAAGDVVYVPRFDGALYATRASDGSTLWSFYLGDSKKLGGAVPGSGNSGTTNGSGSCEWTVPSGSPIYSPIGIAPDGTLIQGTEEGFVYALEER